MLLCSPFTFKLDVRVLQLVVYFGFPYNSTTTLAAGIAILFDAFPFTLLSKGVLDLSDATTGNSAAGIELSPFCQLPTRQRSRRRLLEDRDFLGSPFLLLLGIESAAVGATGR